MRLPHPGRRRRAASITVLLVLALAFAVVLAWQAVGASQHQKMQAERILRDYSRFAAARFASRSAGYLFYYTFVPALKAIDHGFSKLGHVPEPARLTLPDDSDAARISAPFYRRIRFTFEFDTATHRLVFGGDGPAAAWQRWLADTMIARLRTLPPPTMEDVASVIGGPPGDTPKLVVFTLPRAAAGGQARVFGLMSDVEAMNSTFVAVDTSSPLLVPALTGGVALDSIGSVVIHDAHGVPLYKSQAQYASSITAHDTLGSYFANLSVDVSLRPGIAGKLVIGGLPKSRLPLLVALLVLTAGLMLIAMIQLRRESELSALRTQFVSGVSHELRTPLAQIRMFAETLVLGRVRSDDERRRSLEIIDQEARRLTHLVENLLHFSRSERQSVRVAPIPTLLGPVIRGMVESFTPLAETRGVRLHTSLPDGVVASVDEAALRQMLLNFLDNAVKYGPDGQTVTIGLDPVRNERTRLWVQDQGPGIPPGDRERIWEQFWRLERDRGSAIAGTGIGLSVVRELATLHRGRVWVESAPGGGARFVLELPAAPAPTAPSSTSGPVPSPEPATLRADS
ncbi:MAG TPA: HAMP domain-containing sensor histidine kinase [Gemmatimonadales bacterium]|nr:HAMP domain-containing sensor histidine kinase [Gemmatimonadales bacterium]